MRIKILALALLFVSIPLIGCEDDPLEIQDEELLVVRAFIYAGELVQEVELSGTTPLDSDAPPPPVSDAQVRLVRGSTAFDLIPTSGAPGFYHYPGSDLTVSTGDNFELEILFEGRLVTAETTVPPPPEGLVLSSDLMEIPDFELGFGGFGRMGSFSTDPLVVRWVNEDGSTFFLTVENLEEDPEALPFTDRFVNRPSRFISEPVSTDSMYVQPLTLTHYGTHEVTLYHVNVEYADLYLGRTQDSRDLNEPPSNIRGGLGVFSAFAGRKAYFVAVKEG